MTKLQVQFLLGERSFGRRDFLGMSGLEIEPGLHKRNWRGSPAALDIAVQGAGAYRSQLVPHPHVTEFVRIQFNKIIETLDLGNSTSTDFRVLAEFKRECDTVPEIVVRVPVGVPDVELKLCPSPMMEGPFIEDRLGAEDLFTGPAIHFFNCARISSKPPDRV